MKTPPKPYLHRNVVDSSESSKSEITSEEDETPRQQKRGIHGNSPMPLHVNRQKVEYALTRLVSKGSPESAAATKIKIKRSKVKGPRPPEPKIFAGGAKTKPPMLSAWQFGMSMWFNESDVSANSIQRTLQAGSYLDVEAEKWFNSWVYPESTQFKKVAEANMFKTDTTLLESPWGFQDIVEGLKKRFMSPTYTRGAKYQFNNVMQTKKNCRQLTVSWLSRSRILAQKRRRCRNTTLNGV